MANVKYARRVPVKLVHSFKFFLLLVFIFYVQISTIPASRTPVNYTGGGSLAGHWGFYQKAESKTKISNVKNCVLIRVLFSFMSCDGSVFHLFAMVKIFGGSAHFNCLKFFLERGLISKP